VVDGEDSERQRLEERKRKRLDSLSANDEVSFYLQFYIHFLIGYGNLIERCSIHEKYPVNHNLG
jgi:hypothetical protein